VRSLPPPRTGTVNPTYAYAQPATSPAGRPFVRVNMISNLDGAIAINGQADGLGGPSDQRLFHLLRSLADAVVVGAGTMRTEGYGPVRIDDARQAQCQARGQRPVPPIAVATRFCHLDWTSPFFTEAQAQPIILTSDAHDDAIARASKAATSSSAETQRLT
jgi:riboflavin biosynthesis pyrimidine reductase